MDQIRQIVQNVTVMASDGLAYIEEQTGVQPIILFTAIALLVGAYFLISGILAPSLIGAAPPATLLAEVPPPIDGMSASELSQYNGKQSNKPLLMAIKGEIYDISSAKDVYGPGGPFEMFAGRDASRAFVKMSFEESDFSGDLRGLGEYELHIVNEWRHKFSKMFPKVGDVHVETMKRELEGVKEAEGESEKKLKADNQAEEKKTDDDHVEEQERSISATTNVEPSEKTSTQEASGEASTQEPSEKTSTQEASEETSTQEASEETSTQEASDKTSTPAPEPETISKAEETHMPEEEKNMPEEVPTKPEHSEGQEAPKDEHHHASSYAEAVGL